jgi:hypothetical protein
LRDKKELAKVMYLFENTEQNLKKLQQSIIIQKKNRLQYIEFLEQRVKSLLTENKGLKKYYSMNMNNADNINNTNKNLYNNYYSNNDNKMHILIIVRILIIVYHQIIIYLKPQMSLIENHF